MPKYVYGATEASTWLNGNHYAVHVDQPWPADHPLVKAVPSLFRSDPESPGAEVVVETAAAEPGVQRATRRPARPAAE